MLSPASLVKAHPGGGIPKWGPLLGPRQSSALTRFLLGLSLRQSWGYKSAGGKVFLRALGMEGVLLFSGLAFTLTSYGCGGGAQGGGHQRSSPWLRDAGRS